MSRENQRPNPVEDYISKIVNEDTSEVSGSIKLPKPDLQPASKPGPIQSPITERAFEQRKHVFDPTGRIEQIDESETQVADVRMHPFGLVLTYVQFILAIGLSVGLIVFLLPSIVGTSSPGANLVMGILILSMSVFGIVFLLLATRIYRGNQLIITDLNVTQVHQVGLFNRKVSELSMANVEDVTANTQGVFSTLFNYGTLTVETAGEQSNFIFKYCPNPNAYAKALQDARSEYLQKYGGRSH